MGTPPPWESSCLAPGSALAMCWRRVAGALLVIVVCMAFAVALVFGLGRLLGLPPRLAALIAVGTAVCGNCAIAATAPVIEGRPARSPRLSS